MVEDPALQKLVNVLGQTKAEALRDEVFRQLGIEKLSSPKDRLRFGEALVAKGGVLEAIGRSIKVQAILQGAQS